MIGDLRRRPWSSKSLGSRIVSRERFEEISSTMHLALDKQLRGKLIHPAPVLILTRIYITVSDRKRKRRKDGER